jgi:hypothetical protein
MTTSEFHRRVESIIAHHNATLLNQFGNNATVVDLTKQSDVFVALRCSSSFGLSEENLLLVPPQQRSLEHPIQGMRVWTNGFICRLCELDETLPAVYCCPVLKTMTNHVSTCRGAMRFQLGPGEKFSVGPIQHNPFWNKRGSKPYVKVEGLPPGYSQQDDTWMAVDSATAPPGSDSYHDRREFYLKQANSMLCDTGLDLAATTQAPMSASDQSLIEYSMKWDHTIPRHMAVYLYPISDPSLLTSEFHFSAFEKLKTVLSVYFLDLSRRPGVSDAGELGDLVALALPGFFCRRMCSNLEPFRNLQEETSVVEYSAEIARFLLFLGYCLIPSYRDFAAIKTTGSDGTLEDLILPDDWPMESSRLLAQTYVHFKPRLVTFLSCLLGCNLSDPELPGADANQGSVLDGPQPSPCDFHSPSESTPSLDEIRDLLAALFHRTLILGDHPSYLEPRFMILRSIYPNGARRDASYITSQISKLVFGCRAVTLHKVRDILSLLFTSQVLPDPSDLNACRLVLHPAMSLIDLFCSEDVDVPTIFLVLQQNIHHITATSRQKYSSSCIRNDDGSFQVDKFNVSMDTLKAGLKMATVSCNQLFDQLLSGYSISPEFDGLEIVEDFGNMTKGHSFMNCVHRPVFESEIRDFLSCVIGTVLSGVPASCAALSLADPSSHFHWEKVTSF